LGPPYAHPNAASHPNVRTCEHTHTGSDHADPNSAAFCDADRCHGYGHRYGDERVADCDTYTLDYADGDECTADCDLYIVGYADRDERAADCDLYTFGHADCDEYAADGHRDSHADADAHADAGAAAALTNDALRLMAGDFFKEFSRHGFVCISQKAF
jgi:hypothetical protein